MKVKHLLLLLSRHRITVTLSGVLIITIISSLVFVQNVFGQNPLVQMYETIHPIAATAASDSYAESVKPSSDIIHEASTPPETSFEVTPEPAVPITEAPIATAPIAEAPIAVQETTVAASAESTAAVSTAKPTKPASSASSASVTQTETQTIQETVPAETAVEAAAATTAAPAIDTSAGSYDSAMASSVLDVVNQIRMDNGLSALVWNDSLASSAQIRAREVVACWDHCRPDGSDWWTAGDQLQMAENLGKEQSSAAGVVGDWMASSSHAANILNGEYTNMGVACYYCNGTYYWVQEFY